MLVDSADPNLVPTPFFPPFSPDANGDPSSKPSVALITHNVVAMRAEPRSGSEQVSQAILGDRVVCLDVAEEYVHVRTMDEYEGWVWRGSLMPLDAESPLRNWPVAADTSTPCYIQSDIAPFRLAQDRPETLLTRLVCGTRLQVLPGTESTRQQKASVLQTRSPEDLSVTPTMSIDAEMSSLTRPKDGRTFLPGTFSTRHELAQPGDIAVRIPSGWSEAGTGSLQTGYVPADALAPLPAQRYPAEFTGESACTLARRFLGIPYLWGGTTPFGFDCSGFVQRIYSLLNIVLPRDAYQQADSPLGTRFDPTTPTQPGDLVFFAGRSDPRKRGITHVGMALDSDRFIHAVGKEGVIITPFADPYYSGQYTYVGGWRVTGAVRAADS